MVIFVSHEAGRAVAEDQVFRLVLVVFPSLAHVFLQVVSVWFCTTVKCKLTFLGLLNSSSQRFSINTVAFV